VGRTGRKGEWAGSGRPGWAGDKSSVQGRRVGREGEGRGQGK
jgi:hypothetical protein